MREYRKPSEIKLIELILAGSDVITGTPEYKRLLELSKSYIANTLIGVSVPAADMFEEYAKIGLESVLTAAAGMLESYTDQLCEEINQCGYRADCWCDWNYDYEDVIKVYEGMLNREDY